MTRLQKKCLIAAAGLHGALVLLLLLTAAFRSEPALKEEQVLDLVSPRLLDRAGFGGSLPAEAAPLPPLPPQPPQAESHPAPAEPQPAPRSVTREKPAAESKPRETPSKPAATTAAEKPAGQPKREAHEVKPEYTPAVAGAKPGRTEAKRTEPDAVPSRAAAVAGALNDLASGVRANTARATVVELPGQGGGEAFTGYETAIFNAYYRAWKTPDETTDRLAAAEVKIVVARDGSIVSAEITGKSGDAAMDRSVQRALEAVKELPAFPEKATDSQRSFIIKFNLEAKQSSG
jgi:protein TonB